MPLIIVNKHFASDFYWPKKLHRISKCQYIGICYNLWNLRKNTNLSKYYHTQTQTNESLREIRHYLSLFGLPTYENLTDGHSGTVTIHGRNSCRLETEAPNILID